MEVRRAASQDGASWFRIAPILRDMVDRGTADLVARLCEEIGGGVTFVAAEGQEKFTCPKCKAINTIRETSARLP